MREYKEPLSILAVGDVMLGISSIKALATGRTIPERVFSDPTSVFNDIREQLTDSDLLLGTLECPLSDSFSRNDIEKNPFLLGPKCAVEVLDDVDFDCLSLASNHALDHGEQVIEETKQILRNYDIETVGFPLYQSSKQEFQLKGRDIVVGGFNLCKQGQTDDRESLLSFVKENSEADITALIIHWGWGFEHLSYPSQGQVEFGHDLIDSGADIILGSHSHVFQPIELYNDGVIAYSLGNFLFDMWRSENCESGITKIVHDKTGMFDVSITPVKIDDGSVTISKRNMDGLINNSSPDIPSSINRDAKLKNILHNSQIIYHYLRYSTHLSAAYHRKNISRWRKKFNSPREVFR